MFPLSQKEPGGRPAVCEACGEPAPARATRPVATETRLNAQPQFRTEICVRNPDVAGGRAQKPVCSGITSALGEYRAGDSRRRSWPGRLSPVRRARGRLFLRRSGYGTMVLGTRRRDRARAPSLARRAAATTATDDQDATTQFEQALASVTTAAKEVRGRDSYETRSSTGIARRDILAQAVKPANEV